MADSERYRVTGVAMSFPNEEAAYAAAEAKAATSDEEIEVTRCSETTVRVYTRQITVTAQDVPAA